LATPFGSHVTALAAALLEVASTCIFGESTSLATTSTLHTAPATASIGSTAGERGVAAAKGVWSRSAFFNQNLFCADGVGIRSNCSIVPSSFFELYKGTILSRSAHAYEFEKVGTDPLP